MTKVRIDESIRILDLGLPKWMREHLIGTRVPVVAQTREHYVMLRQDLLEVLKEGSSRQRGIWYFLTCMSNSIKDQILLPTCVCRLVREPSSGGGIVG